MERENRFVKEEKPKVPTTLTELLQQDDEDDFTPRRSKLPRRKTLFNIRKG